jgi:HSP20 family protein
MLTAFLKPNNHMLHNRKTEHELTMEKVFRDIFNPTTEAYDIYETATHHYYDISVPGYKRDQIEIEVINGLLVIKGKNIQPERLKFRYKSIKYGEFAHEFPLPDNASDEIKAKLEDGILKIEIPKIERGKSKIKID